MPKLVCSDSHVLLFPRRKVRGVKPQRGRLPMEISFVMLQCHFSKPQAQVADEIGISLSSLKQVCRKLGIHRWPFLRGAKQVSGFVQSQDNARVLPPIETALKAAFIATVYTEFDRLPPLAEERDGSMSRSSSRSAS